MYKLLQPIRGNQTKIHQSEIVNKGKFPVVTQESDKLISGYSDNDKPIEDLPLIIFGDHSCTFKYIDFKFIRGADGTQLLKVDKNIIDTKYLYYLLSNSKIQNSDKYERHFKYLKDLDIKIPTLNEQKKIIDEVEKYEKEIEKAKQIMASCFSRKQAVLDKYLK